MHHVHNVLVAIQFREILATLIFPYEHQVHEFKASLHVLAHVYINVD